MIYRLLFIVALVLSPRAFAQSLPTLGGAGDALLSPQLERRLGESIVRDIRFREPTYIDDPELSEYLGGLGARLSAVTAGASDLPAQLLRRDAATPPLPAAAAGSTTNSLSEFHAPHSAHWPCHLVWSAPHSEHT